MRFLSHVCACALSHVRACTHARPESRARMRACASSQVRACASRGAGAVRAQASRQPASHLVPSEDERVTRHPRWLPRSKAANTRSGSGSGRLRVGLSGTATSFRISRLTSTPLSACSPLNTGVSATRVHSAAETDLSLLQGVQMPKVDVRGTHPSPHCANAPLLCVAAGIAASPPGWVRSEGPGRAPSAAHAATHFPPLVGQLGFLKKSL